MKQANRIIPDLRSCLAGYGDKVPFAFLFGSYARGRQTPRSDIDIAVFFRGMRASGKAKIEQKLSMLFDEPVNVLRLEDDSISPLVRLEALDGLPVVVRDQELLDGFTLSLIHIAEEYRRVLKRLRRAA